MGIISMSDDYSSTKTIKRLKYTLKSLENFMTFDYISILVLQRKVLVL